MSQENIEKWDWRYAFLKHYVNFSFRSYFRKLTVRGKENIPKDSPVIFAPNHQNALMDALAVLYTTDDQPVFLARSDIFRKKTIARILTFLKLLPIYRIRDGYGNLKLNDYIIKKIHDILSKNHYLVIFPEGNHGEKKQLRSLKKGISRIAFQTEEQHDYTLDLKVVPVGLDYSNYYNFNEDLFVNFGKPIDISQFIDLYKENPSKAHLAFRKELSKELKKYMVHIESQDYYETINLLRKIYKTPVKKELGLKNLKQPNKFKTDKKIIELSHYLLDQEPEVFKEIDEKVKSYSEYLKKLNVQDSVVENNQTGTGRLFLNSVIIALTSPIFLYGWLNNLLSYFPAHHFSKKMKDPQFISSIKYGIGMVTFPLFYLIQTILFYVFSDNLYLTAGYLISLPLTGKFAYYFLQIIKKTKTKLRLRNLKNHKKESYKKMMELRREIINSLNPWIPQIHTDN